MEQGEESTHHREDSDIGDNAVRCACGPLPAYGAQDAQTDKHTGKWQMANGKWQMHTNNPHIDHHPPHIMIDIISYLLQHTSVSSAICDVADAARRVSIDTAY